MFRILMTTVYFAVVCAASATGIETDQHAITISASASRVLVESSSFSGRASGVSLNQTREIIVLDGEKNSPVEFTTQSEKGDKSTTRARRFSISLKDGATLVEGIESFGTQRVTPPSKTPPSNVGDFTPARSGAIR